MRSQVALAGALEMSLNPGSWFWLRLTRLWITPCDGKPVNISKEVIADFDPGMNARSSPKLARRAPYVDRSHPEGVMF